MACRSRSIARARLRLAGIAWAALVVATAAVTTAAVAAPARTSVVIGMSIEPAGLDPTAAAPVAIGQVTWQNIFEGLVRIDRDGKIEPQLAKSWTISPDGLTYSFALQTDVTFHDGEAFDAASAKFTLDRARGASSTNPQKQFFTVIESIEAPDPATLVLHLKQPPAICCTGSAGRPRSWWRRKPPTPIRSYRSERDPSS